MGGIPKYSRLQATVGYHGLLGDYHNRPTYPSFKHTGVMETNSGRHITVVALEVLQKVGTEVLGRELPTGALSENFTTQGLGDLSDIRNGQMIVIGEKLRLRVTGQNQPCKHVRAAYGLKFYEAVRGRRGLLCAIESGVSFIVRPGMPVDVLPGDATASADAPPKGDPGHEAKLEFAD
jgi:MOSC domain-containing protein YiiM